MIQQNDIDIHKFHFRNKKLFNLPAIFFKSTFFSISRQPIRNNEYDDGVIFDKTDTAAKAFCTSRHLRSSAARAIKEIISLLSNIKISF